MLGASDMVSEDKSEDNIICHRSFKILNHYLQLLLTKFFGSGGIRGKCFWKSKSANGQITERLTDHCNLQKKAYK